MGLAGPRKRRKLYADLSTIKWNNATTSYGHKILSQQGWTQGSHLGSQDPARIAHHTSGSSAPIKASIKDDTRGIGSRSGKGLDEVPGLDVYQALLSRLNGKEEIEIKKEQECFSKLKRSRWVERRFGTLRFVSAGMMVREYPVKEETKLEGVRVKVERTEIKTEELANYKSEEVAETERQLVEVKAAKKQDKEERKKKKEEEGKEAKKTKKLKPLEGIVYVPEPDVAEEQIAEGPVVATSEIQQMVHRLPFNALGNEADCGLAKTRKKKQKHQETKEPVSLGAHVEPPSISPPPIKRDAPRLAHRRRHRAGKTDAMLDQQALNEILMIRS